MASTLESLRADIRLQDQAELSLGDTLDVKASILLLIVIFLEGMSVGLISTRWPARSQALNFQLAGAVLLAISGILVLVVIWPRDYAAESQSRASELLAYFEGNPGAEGDPAVAEAILKEDISKALERVTDNHAINATKSRILYFAFYVAALAMAFEVVSALMALRPLL
jgi:hypothetical protein